MSFDVKSLFTSIPLQLALDCAENAIKDSTTTTYRRHYGPTPPLFDFDVLSEQTPQTVTRYSYAGADPHRFPPFYRNWSHFSYYIYF